MGFFYAEYYLYMGVELCGVLRFYFMRIAKCLKFAVFITEDVLWVIAIYSS